MMRMMGLDLVEKTILLRNHSQRGFKGSEEFSQEHFFSSLPDIAEHLTTLYLKHCERGNHCLYEGSTPPGVFRNSWNGAMYCNSELAMEKYNEIHTCDRGYDDNRNQFWGAKEGPYELKPIPASCFNDLFFDSCQIMSH